MKFPFRLYAPEGGDGGSGGGGNGGAGGSAGAGAGGAASASGGSGTLLSGSPGNGQGSGAASGSGGAAGAPGSGAGPGGAAGASGAQGGNQGGAGSNSPWFVNLYGADGKIDPKKFDALPDHLKAHKDTFAKYQTVEALLGGMGNLANLAGKKGLEPLPKDAPAELVAERQALMRKLNNVPEKPEGYGIKKPDGLPDDQWNGEYVGGVLGILHKHNASPELVQELTKFDGEFAQKLRQGGESAQAQAMAKEKETLQTEFGADFGRKINLAARAAKTLGLDPENDPMFKTAAGVKAMLKVAEMVSEDRLVSGEGSGDMGKSDREKALDIVNNPANPLYKAFHEADHPQHQHAVETRSAFNKRWHESQRRKAS